jgi:hypothetical protein
VTIDNFSEFALKCASIAMRHKNNTKCNRPICICNTKSNFEGFNKVHSEMAMSCFLNKYWEEISTLIVEKYMEICSFDEIHNIELFLKLYSSRDAC